MLSSRIREARRAKGLTQAQAAAALHINQATYSGYETGKRQPDALKIKQIAALLGVTGDYLLGLDEKKEEPAQTDRLPAGYYTLNDTNRAIVDSLIEQLQAAQSAD